MPENENSLRLKGLLSLDDVLSEVLAVVGNLSPEVVNKERLSEVVFIVGEGHCLEVKSHGGAALNIAELVATSGGVGISVEELGHGGAVLGEISILAAIVPFLIVVDHVVGLGGEELGELLVLEDLIEDVDLVDGRLGALISDASEGGEGEETEVDLPDEGLVEHKEGEAGVGNEGAGPAVVGSVKASVDLIQVISSAHSPLPEIILENVVGVSELVGVALGLACLSTVGAVDGGPVVHVDVVETLRGAEAEVVVAGSSGLSEASHGHGNEASGFLA